jgi:hypothetical protein
MRKKYNSLWLERDFVKWTEFFLGVALPPRAVHLHEPPISLHGGDTGGPSLDRLTVLIRSLECPSLSPALTLQCRDRGQDHLWAGISVYNLLRGVGVDIRVKLERLDRLDLEELLESLGCHGVWTWGVMVL